MSSQESCMNYHVQKYWYFLFKYLLPWQKYLIYNSFDYSYSGSIGVPPLKWEGMSGWADYCTWMFIIMYCLHKKLWVTYQFHNKVQDQTSLLYSVCALPTMWPTKHLLSRCKFMSTKTYCNKNVCNTARHQKCVKWFLLIIPYFAL